MNILRFVPFVGVFAIFCSLLVAEDSNPKDVAYGESLAAWKTKIENLQSIRDKFARKQGEDVDVLRKQYWAAIEEGKKALQTFTDVAENELESGGKHKSDAATFLKDRLVGLLNVDDFEPALRIGQLLMASGYQDRNILEAMGVAAYMTNHPQMAKEYFERAVEEAALPPRIRELAESIPELETAWNEEREIREAERLADDLPRVRLSTSQGDMVVELYENEAPQTVANFLHLVDQDFYDGLSFHRVIPHRVAQGGCPQGDGTGGPGYTIRCESLGEDYRRHFRGSLSMARSAERHTGGSQFFFCLAPASDLDGKHTVFGRIIEGMDVLAKLQRRDPDKKTPRPADKILKAEIERKRDHEYRPTPYIPEQLPSST